MHVDRPTRQAHGQKRKKVDQLANGVYTVGEASPASLKKKNSEKEGEFAHTHATHAL
jgi:hypothetical protein